MTSVAVADGAKGTPIDAAPFALAWTSVPRAPRESRVGKEGGRVRGRLRQQQVSVGTDVTVAFTTNCSPRTEPCRCTQVWKLGRSEQLNIITGARARGVQGENAWKAWSLYENPTRN